MTSARTLVALTQGLNLILIAYLCILFARVFVSWLDTSSRHPLVRFLVAATEPPRRLIWRLLPSALREFPIDVAYLVLFALVVLVRALVLEAAARFGAGPRTLY